MWLLLAACDRAPPATDGGLTLTTPEGDDDDTVPTDGTVDDTGCTTADCDACEAGGLWPPPTSSGDALVAELHALTDTHFCSDYGPATEWMFVVLDNVADTVECVYTGRTTQVIGAKPDATDMNTEHTWPQSLGADKFPAECDLHHLYPTDSDTNALRGNWPFGEVVEDDASVDGGSRFGTDADGDTVFEPRDVHKGNVARSMLYFAMRYGYPLSSGELALYQAWHASDPVDDTEVARSLAIFDRQGGANPYVVCSGLVERL